MSLPSSLGARFNHELAIRSALPSDLPPFRLSIGSQLKLRSFYQHLDSSLETLQQIRADSTGVPSDPKNHDRLNRLLQRLGAFCMEADSWGFEDEYRVAQGLQQLLLESANRISISIPAALERGLDLLIDLVSHSGYDYSRRLAVEEFLESLCPPK